MFETSNSLHRSAANPVCTSFFHGLTSKLLFWLARLSLREGSGSFKVGVRRPVGWVASRWIAGRAGCNCRSRVFIIGDKAADVRALLVVGICRRLKCGLGAADAGRSTWQRQEFNLVFTAVTSWDWRLLLVHCRFDSGALGHSAVCFQRLSTLPQIVVCVCFTAESFECFTTRL